MKNLMNNHVWLVANFLKLYQILVGFSVAEPIWNQELYVIKSEDMPVIFYFHILFSWCHEFIIQQKIVRKISMGIAFCFYQIFCMKSHKKSHENLEKTENFSWKISPKILTKIGRKISSCITSISGQFKTKKRLWMKKWNWMNK